MPSKGNLEQCVCTGHIEHLTLSLILKYYELLLIVSQETGLLPPVLRWRLFPPEYWWNQRVSGLYIAHDVLNNAFNRLFLFANRKQLVGWQMVLLLLANIVETAVSRHVLGSPSPCHDMHTPHSIKHQTCKRLENAICACLSILHASRFDHILGG